MRDLTGFFLIIISAAAYGAMPILARVAYRDGADPLTVLFLRFSIAAALTWGLLAWQRWRSDKRQPMPSRRAVLGLIGLGVTCYVGQALCYFTALTLASASLVALLLYLYPVLVTILSAALLKERLTLAKLSALGLALIGAVLLVGRGGGGQPLGIALGLGAAVIYSIAILAGSRLLQTVPALPATAIIMASAGVVFGGLMALRGPSWPLTAAGWAASVGLAVVAGVIAIGTFLAGLARVGPTNAATLSTLEPVVAVFLAWLLLGESLTPASLAGGSLILAAVIGLARSELGGRPAAPRKAGGVLEQGSAK